jgi:hypothetical protein
MTPIERLQFVLAILGWLALAAGTIVAAVLIWA